MKKMDCRRCRNAKKTGDNSYTCTIEKVCNLDFSGKDALCSNFEDKRGKKK